MHDTAINPHIGVRYMYHIDWMVAYCAISSFLCVLQKNPSMLHYLQQALQEQQQGGHNGEPGTVQAMAGETSYVCWCSSLIQRESTTVTRAGGMSTLLSGTLFADANLPEKRTDSEVEEFIASLSPKDQELVKVKQHSFLACLVPKSVGINLWRIAMPRVIFLQGSDGNLITCAILWVAY